MTQPQFLGQVAAHKTFCPLQTRTHLASHFRSTGVKDLGAAQIIAHLNMNKGNMLQSRIFHFEEKQVGQLIPDRIRHPDGPSFGCGSQPIRQLEARSILCCNHCVSLAEEALQLRLCLLHYKSLKLVAHLDVIVVFDTHTAFIT